ncbi:hypothetical protein DQP57_00345 [Mycobacterium colombiense]|uniref:Uncharacterized protein n=1 Tax=Mycobacterium colombiense TaxID=339268 RepID=A0A329MBR5_9MYCO|nr:hypothetical protein [Mycobacterium colombiense]RAV17509.1 hypothetical protein DQP57_00345 [Mycobacterium colombiense]
MSYPITRVVVKDNPPPKRPVISVGRIYPTVISPEPETVFSTVRREEDSEAEKSAETETKVVRGRRRPAPKANEAAESK